MYHLLAAVFFTSVFIVLTVLSIRIFLFNFWIQHRSYFRVFLALWFIPYLVFILFFTGPLNLQDYPPAQDSPYKQPWKAGVTRFVAQGNRSFTSHRAEHTCAWDFVMSNGTEILAARDGTVVEILDSADGIGFLSNFVSIEHVDGSRATYAHIQTGGARAKLGESVRQGQTIALSGMVGQTIFPHVHFYVVSKSGLALPISFKDVEGGVPFAGHAYTSQNR